ncbi:MAG: lysozyme [Hydrogenophaga sp.]|uniref:lysozyme n=1 Tax=Hydrogenophaga sp. TaxID=1904254 RepID=UPI002AB9ECB4|nr:lysozyme [Hydrogenophaga sp.]MDZ4282829.1 lysozyme [Hydrogenophaga sp.]
MKNPRAGIAGLMFSAAALIGLALSESYTDKAIIPTKGDVPTLGFGTTTRPDGSPVRMGDTTTPVDALQRKARDLQKFEGAIKQCVTVPLYQHEYDAYVDMAYNIGQGAFCGSTIVKRLNASDYKGACDAILMWKRVAQQDCSVPGNRICWGLWQRRLATHKQCLGPAG